MANVCLTAVVAVTLLVPACSSADPTAAVASSGSQTAGGLDSIPASARVTDGGGEPRAPDYWVVWSTCGEDNRSAVAASNGGREAGWVLLDDLLEDPGVAVGDVTVRNCVQGVGLLEAATAPGSSSEGAVHRLASLLLAAELNLAVGSESCTAAEAAVVSGHSILSFLAFDGSDVSLEPDEELAQAIAEIIFVLDAYSGGSLCR